MTSIISEGQWVNLNVDFNIGLLIVVIVARILLLLLILRLLLILSLLELSLWLRGLLWHLSGSKWSTHVILSILRWKDTMLLVLHVGVLRLTHEIGWPLFLHVLRTCSLECLLLSLRKCANISKISPTVDSLRSISALRCHNISVHSLFLLLVFSLEHRLVRVLHIRHGLHRFLTN